jgi:lambda family phage tail tape measure protein
MNLDALLRIKASVDGENNIRRLGNSMQGVQGKVKNLQAAVGGLSGALKGLAAGLALGAFTAFVKQGIDAADAMGKAATRTGVAAQALLGMQNAAALADVSNEQLIKGLTKLNVNIVSAAEGNDELNKRFQQLGITIKAQDGTLKSTEQIFREISDRFADMPDGAQKAAAAVSLFGKSGVELITLLNSGAASFDEFNYKLSDEFAARSEYFNDSITKMGFKTQGFQMQLMDALLPALQSILDEFSNLFSTEQDWTALFDVIIFGMRSIATVIFATVKLVDVLVKSLVAAVDVAYKLFIERDIGAAFRAVQNRFTDVVAQARQDFAAIGRMWTDAPAPGGRARTRGFEMRDLAAERERDAAAKKAASEAERLAQKRNDIGQKALSLQEQLRRKLEDVNAAYAGVGATPIEQLLLDRADAVRENNRQVDDMTKQVVDLVREITAAGGQIDVSPFRTLIDQISEANVALADKELADGLREIGKAAAEAAIDELEFVDALEAQGRALDGARDGIDGYLESIGTLSENISGVTQNALRGLEDAIVSLTTTGKFSFRDFALSIIDDLTRMATRMLIIAPILQFIKGLLSPGPGALEGVNALKTAIPGFALSANGNVFAQNGIQKFARGGVVSRPTMFPFANGIGLMGEAGPEAIMPLRRGRDGRLGIEAGNGGGTVVNVSVDAKGTSVEGNTGQGQQLGRAIAAAVQAELIKQKRPGGLLTT